MQTIMAGIKQLSRFFLVGILAVFPLVITVGVVIWLTNFLGDMLGPGTPIGDLLAKLGGLQIKKEGFLAYVLGWLIVLGVVFLLGVLLESGAKRFLQDRFDWMVKKIPIMGGIYGTARQMADMMDTKADTELKSMSVVYCVLGSSNGAMILALMPTSDRFRIGERDYHAILIPTAPVPFGGALLYVPCDCVIRSDMSVDSFMSIYVSMGVTGPDFLPLGSVEPKDAKDAVKVEEKDSKKGDKPKK